MPCQQVTPKDIELLNKKRCWATALTAGSITATVSYWISQLPPYLREETLNKILAVLALK